VVAGAAAVAGIGFFADEAVTSHPRQGLGHSRLVDTGDLAQLALRAPVALEQGKQRGELPGHHPVGGDALAQGGLEQAGQPVDLVADGRCRP
jgi:hypothetical protein